VSLLSDLTRRLVSVVKSIENTTLLEKGAAKMESLFRRNWHTSVRRGNDDVLESETSYLDTNRESVARLRVGVSDFIIRDAEWEEQRPVPVGRKIQPVPLLAGKDSYLNAGPALRELAAVTDDPLLVPLFAEAVKGIIQAETFLWKERGYSSIDEYEKGWEEFYRDSCRYYSNLDRVTQNWFHHVGETTREGSLFVRFKTQTLYFLGNDTFLLSGSFSDSFHQISLTLTLDREMKVTRAEGNLLRAPDAVCKESDVFLKDLVGLNLKSVTKKEIANVLGRDQGCVHVIDLTFDAAQVLNYCPS
jgi:hypothetical protein